MLLYLDYMPMKLVNQLSDLFEYSKNQAPKHIVDQANEHHMHVLNYLEELASHIRIEEQHVVVLDWLNGNRSILSNSHLTGSIFGLTLQTPYEMIHRAYIEATAFGTKLIMKQFEDNHIPVHTVYASGGIPQKLLVEIYANVLNKRVVVIDSSNASALGAAMLGANVGNAYSTLKEAALSMKQPIAYIQEPEIQKVQAYKPLYHKYCELHDLLGRQYPELSYLI